MPRSENAFASAAIAALIVATVAKAGFGASAVAPEGNDYRFDRCTFKRAAEIEDLGGVQVLAFCHHQMVRLM